MPDELRLAAGFLLAATAAMACTPLAISVATRTGFHDKPVGYKGHASPTPYLGGAAVVAAFTATAFGRVDSGTFTSPVLSRPRECVGGFYWTSRRIHLPS